MVAKAFTHSGNFHADDVMSSAFLKLVNPSIIIERGFSVPKDYDGIVFDIGLGEFDHHQVDNEIRENGIPYAAFGKLWREFSHELGLTQQSLDCIESLVVQPVDYTDNTGEYNPLSFCIKCFNPDWNSDQSSDETFNEAVEFAKLALEQVVKHYKAVEAAEKEMAEAVKTMQNGIIVLEHYVPMNSLDAVEDAKLVVFPSNRGGWNINAVKGHFEFPEAWVGASADELSLPGLTFCHPGRFMCCAETREQAINIAKIALSCN